MEGAAVSSFTVTIICDDKSHPAHKPKVGVFERVLSPDGRAHWIRVATKSRRLGVGDEHTHFHLYPGEDPAKTKTPIQDIGPHAQPRIARANWNLGCGKCRRHGGRYASVPARQEKLESILEADFKSHTDSGVSLMRLAFVAATL